VAPVEPAAAGFPFARSAIHVRRKGSDRHRPEAWQEAWYVSSLEPADLGADAWLDRIRGHWAGCEIKNHWRKDAILGEDGTRSRHPRVVANLALLRNIVIVLLADHQETYVSLPVFIEAVAQSPAFARRLVMEPG